MADNHTENVDEQIALSESDGVVTLSASHHQKIKFYNSDAFDTHFAKLSASASSQHELRKLLKRLLDVLPEPC